MTRRPEQTSIAFRILTLAMLLLPLLVLYVGAYYTLVRRQTVAWEHGRIRPIAPQEGIPFSGSSTRWILVPRYSPARWPDLAPVFVPIHHIDRHIRPEYWDYGRALMADLSARSAGRP